MQEKHKNISQLRIRIVAFRDYLADQENAMLVTDFFNLPQQEAEFEECVKSLYPIGGGDEPEDGLEALAYAIKSKWDTTGVKSRHVIVVWTDEATHPLGFGRSSSHYPSNMAKDIIELSDWWNNSQFIDKNSKRLVLYAPDVPDWNIISETWDNVVHFPSEAGKGLDHLDYGEIINTIVNSIG